VKADGLVKSQSAGYIEEFASGGRRGNLKKLKRWDVMSERYITSPGAHGLGGEKMKTMNGLLLLKSPLAFVLEDMKMGFPMRVGHVVFWVALIFANLTGVAFGQSSSCPGIHVKVMDIRNSAGTVDCALFDSPVGFPVEVLLSATNVMVIRVRETEARCDFEDIPPGTYALAVIHDENMNGKLDINFIGIPKEGYGFSNGAKGLFGAPSFSAASFQYDGGTLNLTISLHY
jgi:uncharacterized protein (DUF2141 family)